MLLNIYKRCFHLRPKFFLWNGNALLVW